MAVHTKIILGSQMSPQSAHNNLKASVATTNYFNNNYDGHCSEKERGKSRNDNHEDGHSRRGTVRSTGLAPTW